MEIVSLIESGNKKNQNHEETTKIIWTHNEEGCLEESHPHSAY